MSIEPHAVITVSTPAIRTARQDPERTLAEYQADIRKRFGGRMPSWPELAKRENAARLNRNPVSSMARPQPTHGHANTQAATTAATEARIAKGEETRASIFKALTKPMTCPDVATVLKRSPELVRRHLSLLAEQGRVIGRNVKGVTVWERMQEAAE